MVTNIGASPDGWTWVVNPAQQIFRYNVDGKKWDVIPGGLCQISVLNKDIAVGVNSGGGTYLWKNNQWAQIGTEGLWVSIGENEERWLVKKDNTVWRWQTNNWVLKPGKAVQIDVYSEDRIIMTNADNEIFKWTGENWKKIEGRAQHVSIDAENIYIIQPAMVRKLVDIPQKQHHESGEHKDEDEGENRKGGLKTLLAKIKAAAEKAEAEGEHHEGEDENPKDDKKTLLAKIKAAAEKAEAEGEHHDGEDEKPKDDKKKHRKVEVDEDEAHDEK